MKRRYFGSLALSLPFASLAAGRQVLAEVLPRDLASLIGELTSDHTMAARLGATYLAVADERQLTDTLRRFRERNPTRIAELRAALAELAQEDLARQDTVLVDGWVLARAEAEAL